MEENKNNSKTDKPKIEIEINKYKRLVDILNSPKLLARAIVVLAVIITLVFVGVSVLAIVIKGFYPYKAVETNKYGATVIKNEDTEVTYWLFNSADLWANSGIKVEKGQRITVRTSGAFHSAIHHLVEDASKNQQRDKWLNATGGIQSLNSRDKARSEFRIAQEYEFNTIIMQVIPQEVFKSVRSGEQWFKFIPPKHSYYFDYVDGGAKDKANIAKIYKIGESYENIEIQETGVLCFACNDIALTDRKIASMQSKISIDSTGKDIGELEMGNYPAIYQKKDLDSLIVYIDKNDSLIKAHCYDKCLLDTLKKKLDNLYEALKDKSDNDSLLKAPCYNNNDSIGKKDIGLINDMLKRTLTELDYYKMNKFVDAWFVDNVGSFLIVVEREK